MATKQDYIAHLVRDEEERTNGELTRRSIDHRIVLLSAFDASDAQNEAKKYERNGYDLVQVFLLENLRHNPVFLPPQADCFGYEVDLSQALPRERQESQ